MPEFGKNLVEGLRNGKQLHDDYAKNFQERYMIAGKVISEWKEDFRIEIEPDSGPEGCITADIKLLKLHQTASFNKSESQARVSTLKNIYNTRYRTEFNRIVTEYKTSGQKLPAKDTIGQMAEEAAAELKDALSHAETENDFWKETLADLANARKVINDMTVNLSVEAKALQNERSLDHLIKSRS